MLKSGKELKVFSVKYDDLKKFTEEAKRYGVLFSALIDKKQKNVDGMVDIMVKAEDARTAVQMEPNNPEYINLLNQLENTAGWYSGMGNGYGQSGAGAGNCCAQMLCFELLCHCCCCGGY